MRVFWRTVSVTVLVGVLLIPLVGVSGAADGGRVSPVLGGDFRISGPAASLDANPPAVAHNATTGEFLVVWIDTRQEAVRGADAYGQRVAADGTRVGHSFRISGRNAVGGEAAPAVAWSQTANEYLVVWVDWRSAPTRGTDIYGRRIGADGSPVGGDFRISGRNALSDEHAPAVAYNETANEYLVVWSDRRSGATRGTDIYGRRIGADGSPVGGDFRISGRNATSGELSPAVAWNQTANEYLVVWSDGRRSLGSHIYGRRVGTEGLPVGRDRRLSGLGSDYAPEVARSETADEYLVVWETGHIYGRRIGPHGIPIGEHIRISGPDATAYEWVPAVAWGQTAGQYLVVWMDAREAWQIRGRRVGVGGLPAEDDFRINGGAASYGVTPAAAWNQTADQFLVIWLDGRDYDTHGYRVYGRRVAG